LSTSRVSIRLLVLSLVLLISTLFFSHPLIAQGNGVDIDSDHSVAELFIGSPADPYSFSPGYARVIGELVLNVDEPNKTLLDVHIFPANVTEGGRHDLATQIEFVSKHVAQLADGSLAIQGDLALTRVERNVSADPSEAYSGPVYGESVVRTSHHRATFVLAGEATKAKLSSRISAETKIARQEFPELLSTITSIDWPVVVQDEHCAESVSGSGEGYAGQNCSGKVLSPTNRIAAASAPGEDFPGVLGLPPIEDQVTVRLALRTLEIKKQRAW